MEVLIMTSTKETIEKGANLFEISAECCTIEIPDGIKHSDKIFVEIRRSYLNDAAFIIVEGMEVTIVEQCDIWKTIQNISERLFRAFGVYKPDITWPNRTQKVQSEKLEYAVTVDTNILTIRLFVDSVKSLKERIDDIFGVPIDWEKSKLTLRIGRKTIDITDIDTIKLARICTVSGCLKLKRDK
jgi:hypothetical protein